MAFVADCAERSEGAQEKLFREIARRRNQRKSQKTNRKRPESNHQPKFRTFERKQFSG